MAFNQWVCPYPDGHFPKLCPDSLRTLVAFGGGGTPTEAPTVRLMDWRTSKLYFEARGRLAHWLTPSIVTWVEELAPGLDQRWEYDITSGVKRKTADDPALVAGNEFVAGSGHWASYLALPGRRVVVDGRIHPSSGALRGVSIDGGELLSCVNDQVLQLYDLTTLAPTRAIMPGGTFNKWRKSAGMVFHGYFGDTWAATPSQVLSTMHTITPWHAEGVAVGCIGTGGRVWAATSTEIAASTKEVRVGVLIRPFGDARCLAVWDVEMDTLDMQFVAGRLVVAGASTKGVLTVIDFAENSPLMPVTWPMGPERPFTQAVAFGGYHEVTTHPAWPMKTTLPFANCTIVTDANALAKAGEQNVIVHAGNLAEVTRPEKVVGFYEGSESADPEVINRYCRDIRKAWTKKFPQADRIPPVICYIQPAQMQNLTAVPNEVDIFSPQIYFELGKTPTHIDYFYWMNWWMQRLPADRLWMPTVQTYDRNLQWSADQMTLLANQQGALISVQRAFDHVIGFACFAVNRTGGIEKYPELREALSRVGTVGRIGSFPSRWPYRPHTPVDPIPEPEPEPEPPVEDDMTAEDLEKWTAEILDSVPEGDPRPTLFGAMKRYHDEVLGRDRPKDGIIKNADNTDMWTGDVVTGGAMGYFVRSMMYNYYVNRSKGQPYEQAWPNAYDKAIASYNKAVGNPQ